MVSKLSCHLIDVSLAVASSVLLILSFPAYDLGFFAWAGLIPLLLCVQGKSLMYGFLLSIVSGMIFFLGVFSWILEVPKYTLFHHSLLAVYLGSYFAFFGLTFCCVSSYWGKVPALCSAPFIWVSLEWVRSNLSFLALPWGLLAHSQYKYPLVIQIASVLGTYSISFLVVMVNAAIAGLLFYYTPTPAYAQASADRFALSLQGGGKVRSLKGDGGRLKGRKYLLVATASLLFFALLHGYYTIPNAITGNKVKISLVQGNIEQPKKWDPQSALEIMETYARLTEEASKTQPALIIWPETATPGSISINPTLQIKLRGILRKAGTHILLGSAQPLKLEREKAKDFRHTNAAYLFDPLPKLVRNQRYDKICLFPFGEYLPYREVIPWSLINVAGSDNYIPGKTFTVFEHPDFRFGVTICWENVFPYLVRQFVLNGAQCIINLTNEAHFGRTAAPYQLVSISVFRAVENGVYVVRCANTGVSCIIDPYGRIVDRVKNEEGRNIFVQGAMSGFIIPTESNTIYTRCGDVFVWVAFLGAVVFLVVALFKKKINHFKPAI